MDPLAEKYYDISPYAWCGNNPVNRIDPDGMDYWSTSDPEQIRAFMQSYKAGNSSYNFSQWNHIEDAKFIKDFKATFNDETGKFYTSSSKVIDGVFTVIGQTIDTNIRPGLTSYGWPYEGLQVYDPIGNDFGSKISHYVFGENATYNVGQFSWNVNVSGRITGVQPLTGTPDLIGGKAGGKIFIKGLGFINKKLFHEVLKKDILKAVGKDISKVIGKNPDITVESGKIVLKGTGGGFRGKTYNTGLSASDFFE